MARFFTDFAGYTLNAQPSNWTERWNTASFSAAVVTHGFTAPSTGNTRALRLLDSNTVNERYALSWDDVGTPSGDVEVLALCYGSMVSPQRDAAQVILHGGGAAASEDAYLYNATLAFSDESRLQKYVGGTLSTIGTADAGMVENAWFWVRLQRTGTTIQMRVWLDGNAEPGTWTVSDTDTSHSSGWVGLGINRAAPTAYFAQIGVGTGGDSAPDEAFGMGGVVYRYVDASNYFRAYIRRVDNTVRLDKVIAGTPTNLGNAEWVARASDELRVIVQGNRHRVYAGFTLWIDVEDSSLNTATKAGLYSEDSDGGITFANFYGQGL